MRTVLIRAAAVIVAALIGFVAGDALGGGGSGLSATAVEIKSTSRPVAAIAAGPSAPVLKSAGGGTAPPPPTATDEQTVEE